MAFSVPVDGKPVRIVGRIPVLPLRDVVLFPGMTLPLFVGRIGSLAAIEKAWSSPVPRTSSSIAPSAAPSSSATSGSTARPKTGLAAAPLRLLFAVAQRRPEVSSPRQNDLYETGVVAQVVQVLRLPDGTMRVMLRGLARSRSLIWHEEQEFLEAELGPAPSEGRLRPDTRALLRRAQAGFLEYARLNPRIAEEIVLEVTSSRDPVQASFTMAACLLLKVSARQELLEASQTAIRLQILSSLLATELDLERLEARVGGRLAPADEVHAPRGGPRATKGEAREGDESSIELAEIDERIRRARLPKAVEEKARREMERLARMSFLSPEATVCRTYLEWLLAIPWRKSTRERTELGEAQRILEKDHFGLAAVKDRILELISVLHLSKEVRGPVLCLLGPPGVGKTSLGRSVANALGRRFIRMSLGGVRDEAEIRGHRRTYIGAMPGRIVQAMRRAGTVNPVILLDEVDKLGLDYRGDPSAALLEVLDPEQNSAFNDHYLEVDFDLSRVLFLTTANSAAGIPPALRDRMEVISIPGYLDTEKQAIAERFLLPKQRKACGLKPEDLSITGAALDRLIREYTREAGVRNLEREIARLCRRAARKKAFGNWDKPLAVGPADLESVLGTPHYAGHTQTRRNRIGLAAGLAWSEVGGSVLQIEVGVLPGRGKLILTGNLGSMLKESAQAALSALRARAGELGLPARFHERIDIHLHIPEGDVPKDGPSAGIAIALALASALTRRPTRAGIALTGELTLQGQVLPIGGLGAKSVAALRSGIRTILLPAGNRRAWSDLPEEVRSKLRPVFVHSLDQVLSKGLARPGRTGRVSGEGRLATLSEAARAPGVIPLPAGSRREVQRAPASAVR